MYSQMLSASNNHAKIKMVLKHDNQKVTTDIITFFLQIYSMHKTETKKGVDKDECCVRLSNVVKTGRS